MKLRCYVCGKPPGRVLHLVSMQEESDRVFVVCAGCVARVGDGALTCAVRKT